MSITRPRRFGKTLISWGAMNYYMNDISDVTFSSFDTGNHPSERMQPERFYHGFVLGLLAELVAMGIEKGKKVLIGENR